MSGGCLYKNRLIFMSLKEAQQFVVQFNKGEYTPGEYAAFLQWLKGATLEELTIITDVHESVHGEWVLPEGPSAGWVMQLEQKLNQAIEEQEEETVMGDREKAPVLEMQPERKRRRNLWMAAAAVVIFLLTGTYIYVRQTGSGELSNRAKLLSMRFVNPRGGTQKELVLEDGSKIWLNAGSVLRYPPHFTGSERLVQLSGEAFFDVAGNSGGPFRVLIRDAEVDVLGTYFTVMVYDNEPVSRTTLVHGAVKVTSEGGSVVLKPGEQAEIVYASPGVTPEIATHSGIDPKSVLAWRSGIYRFEGTELHTIMRELERVYDVTVQYQSNVGNPQINGTLNLNRNLDIVLKQLEGAALNKIHFSHNGKLVIASPT
jgi:ferric-dicitrate binding protein FerR (iron transport regulator)